MHHQKILIPQGCHHTAKGKAEKIRFFPHRRTEYKIGRQQQKATAETQRYQVSRCFERLNILHSGKLKRRNTAAVLVDVVGILDNELYLPIRAGEERNRHITHPRHEPFFRFRHPSKFRCLHPIDKDTGGIVQRKAADSIIPVRLRQNPQTVGAIGPVGRRDIRSCFLSCCPRNKVLRSIQPAGIKIPPAGDLEYGRGNILLPDIQYAVFHCDGLHRGGTTEKGAHESQQAEGNHRRQKPADRLLHCTFDSHGKSPFPSFFQKYFLSFPGKQILPTGGGTDLKFHAYLHGSQPILYFYFTMPNTERKRFLLNLRNRQI